MGWVGSCGQVKELLFQLSAHVQFLWVEFKKKCIKDRFLMIGNDHVMARIFYDHSETTVAPIDRFRSAYSKKFVFLALIATPKIRCCREC